MTRLKTAIERPAEGITILSTHAMMVTSVQQLLEQHVL